MLIVLVTLLGGVLRIAAAVVLAPQLAEDPDAYRLIAVNLVNRGVMSRAAFPPDEIASQAPSSVTPTAFRPPVYPIVLAGLAPLSRRIDGFAMIDAVPIAGLHVGLGMITVLATMLAARGLLGSRGTMTTRLVAGGLVATDPLLLTATAQVMTETLAAAWAAVLTVGLVWLGRQFESPAPDPTNPRRSARAVAVMTIGGAVALGLVWGLATLTRPVFLIWAVLVGGTLVWRAIQSQLDPRPNRRQRRADSRAGLPEPGQTVSESDQSARHPLPITSRWQKLAIIVGLGLGLSLPLAVWTIRNQLLLGEPIATTTHGGYTLLLANNDDLYDHLLTEPWWTPWMVEDLEAELLARRADPDRYPQFFKPHEADLPEEIRFDRAERRWAWETIARRPGAFAWSVAVRLARFWSPLPHAEPLGPTLPLNEPSSAQADESQVAEAQTHDGMADPASVDGGRGAETPSLRSRLRWLVAVYYLFVYGLAIAGLIRVIRSWRHQANQTAWTGVLLAPIAFLVIHSLYWTDMRMRAPIMPIVALTAAAALSRRPVSGASPVATSEGGSGYDGNAPVPPLEPA